MHGDWDDQTATWDSLTEEFRWDYNIFDTSVLLGTSSGFIVKDSFVVFRVLGQLGSKAGIDSNSAGSSFVSKRTLGMKSKVVGTVNAVNGFETLSFGTKSGFDYTKYHLFMNADGKLSMTSGVEASPNTHTSLEHSFDMSIRGTASPAGSIFHLDGELKMRTRLADKEVNTDFVVSGSLGSKSGLPAPDPDVNFSTSVWFASAASASGTCSLILPKEASLSMGSMLYAASGNTFFEEVVFNGVISGSITANYTARDVAMFYSTTGLDVDSHVDFAVESLLEMGLAYTVRDGWWIRPIPTEGSDWVANSELKNDWQANASTSGNGWKSDEF